MNNKINLFSLILFLLLCQPASMLFSNSSYSNQEPLSKVLEEIGDRYSVFFSYEASTVENIDVHFDFVEDEKLDDALHRLFEDSNLGYDVFGSKYIVIYNKTESTSKDLSNLRTHFRKIEEIESKGNLKVSRIQDVKESISISNHNVVKDLFVGELVKGFVFDETGEPLIGATIVIKDTTIGTTTDIDGSFSLEVSSFPVTLVVSYIGYQPKEVNMVDNTNSIEIQLDLESAELQEIVVIGYGTSKKKDVTGAIVNVENINDRSVTNVEEALQGNVAGLTVVGDGGDPTSLPKISIRGVGSLSDESPLWVVDGVPYYGAPLNPFDIESMTVLKDAASTAIYGVKAAGGVILVTTKKGRSGKLKVNFDTYVGVQNVWKKPIALTASEQADFYNITDDNTGNDRDPLHDADVNPEGQISRTDWVDEIFQTGKVQNYNLGISGGSDQYTFSSSLGYNKRSGTLLNTEATRMSLRYNSIFKLNDKFRVGENISITKTNGNSAFTGTQAANGETNYNGIIAQAIKAPPHVPVYNSDGEYSDMPPAGYGLTIHPVATLNRITIDNPVTDLFGNLYAEYDLLKNLKFRSAFGINIKDGLFKEFTPRVPEASKTTNSVNSLELVNFNQTDWSWENTVTFTPDLGNSNSLTLLGGYTKQAYSYDLYRIIGENFQNEDESSQFLVNAGNYRVLKDEDGAVSDYQENRLISYFFRANYSWDSKYLFSASVRRDGSSKLGDNNRWGLFPAFSAAWQLSEESFIKDVQSIDLLKVRASWGRIGNITSLSNYPTNVPLSSTSVILGERSPVNGIALDGISNPNITWETSEQLNFGIDATLFDYKFSVNADYFIKSTYDLIVPLPITSLAGVNNFPYVNAGQVDNRGIELGITYKKLSGELQYRISGNVAAITNELVALEDGISKILDNTQVATHFPIESAIGQPLLSFNLIESDGIFQSNEEANSSIQPNAVAGDLRFVDQNNDGKINAEDRVYKGNAFPDFTYGFNMQFDYKKFDLSVFFQGTRGAVAYNGFRLMTLYPAQTSVARANLSSDAANTWYPGNTDAEYFRLSDNDPNDNLRASDFWLENADYLRFKNLSLGYNFSPTEKFDNCRIYITGQNLLTFTNYSGLDPEVGNNGIDGGQYPLSRSFLIGFNVGF